MEQENKNSVHLEQVYDEEQEVESLVVDPTSLIAAVGMNFNFKKAERFWEQKHGIIAPPMELQDTSGKRYDNGKWKAIIKQNNFVNLVSRNYVVFPNEEVLDIVNKIVSPESGLRILGEPKFTNNGLNMFVNIVSDKHIMKIEKSYQENDFVNLGVIVRNSLGGGIALGTDIFTFRQICSNGAIFGYNELGSDYMRHYGKNSEKIALTMRNLITDSLSRFEDIHQYYEKMATTPIGEKNPIFKKLEPHISQKYYPDFVEIELHRLNKDDKNFERVYSYSKDYANTTLWEVFNDFTEKIWHADSVRMDAKRDQTRRLHQVVIEAAYKR